MGSMIQMEDLTNHMPWVPPFW